MRYIDINQLVVEAQWEATANTAAAAVKKAKPANRSTVINDHQQVWKDLKDQLREISYGKCWYCESIDPRSDNAVDHYRPKGNVRNSNPPHSGYWWLAFKWRNYRFCCTYCNSIRNSATTSGGKQDYFPLADETKRAVSEKSDIEEEAPLLLDPTDPLDVKVIAFAEDGTVGPAADEKKDPLACRRAKESIERYHLDHPTINERRVMKLRQVRRWVEEADKNLARWVKQPTNGIWRRVATSRIQDILHEVSPKADYSMAVKHLLAAMANKSVAAKTVLDSL
jgi:uncharacterized protein (TIGR02646 family)